MGFLFQDMQVQNFVIVLIFFSNFFTERYLG